MSPAGVALPVIKHGRRTYHRRAPISRTRHLLVARALAWHPASPMRTQAEKAAALRALHARDGAFIIPNPWDPGTAHLLARLGFEALATTSAGYAFSIAKRDNRVGR